MGVDIGRKGMRLETEAEMTVGVDVEIAFPRAVDNIRCFGQIAWVKPLGSGRIGGVAVESWVGVVLGEESWTRYKSATPKKDRRGSPS